MTSAPRATSTINPFSLNLGETTIPSPDGKWIAHFLGYNFLHFRLSVTNLDKAIVWNINQPNIGGDWFEPYRWSKDSRYLYFNIHVSIDGYVPFYNGMGLQRLDVSNGTISEILSSGYLTDSTHHIYNWNIVSFSLSPNDKQLAYINNFDNEIQLVIRDLKTGNEKSLFFKGYNNAGSMVWSPQQNQLVLAVTKGMNWSNTVGSIKLVDLDTLTSRNLMKDEKRVLDPVKWINSNMLLLEERGGEYFSLDMTTKNLMIAPPTVFPK